MVDGRIAVELRVWEAIDRGYLAPFQYFGVSDTEDLSNLTWRRGGYDTSELNNLFTGNDVRARRVVQAVEDSHASANTMRALGFCVSIAHADFMAEQFSKLGLDSLAISGLTPEAEHGRPRSRVFAPAVYVASSASMCSARAWTSRT